MTDYFSLYELPVSFRPDPARVREKYYELSRRYHPDRMAGAGAEALLTAAQVNEGFRVLRNADATLAYLLKLQGIVADEEKYNLPPDFLMEMMDLNETLSDLEPGDDAALGRARQELDARMAEWQLDADKLFTLWDGGDHSGGLLAEIKDFYFRKKYLLRIQERINTFAAQP
jgi:molecular chaperone HscB